MANLKINGKISAEDLTLGKEKVASYNEVQTGELEEMNNLIRLMAQNNYLNVLADGGLKVNNVKLAPASVLSYDAITCTNYKLSSRVLLNFPIGEEHSLKFAMFTIADVAPTAYTNINVTLQNVKCNIGYAIAQESNARNWERQNAVTAFVVPSENTTITVQLRDDGGAARAVRVVAFLYE